MPPASPAPTMFTYRSLKALGCLARAVCRVAPCSTSVRTALMIFWKPLSTCWAPRISRHCTRGRPASIITLNCRVKMARSLALTLPVALPPAADWGFTEITWTPLRFREPTALSMVSATITPSWMSPRRFLPFHTICGH